MKLVLLHASRNCYFGDHAACLATMECNRVNRGEITPGKNKKMREKVESKG